LPSRTNFVSRAKVTSGEYEVRIKRTSVVPTDSNSTDAYWTALRTIVQDDPVPRDNMCLVALRIRATGQLNGIIDNFNCIAKSKIPVWDSGWTDTVTNNPAWIYADIIQGNATNNPLADARMDLSIIKDFADFCDAGSYAFNAVIDTQKSTYELLRAVTAAGQGSFAFNESDYSAVWDTTDSTVVQMFTPRNSWGYTCSRDTFERPHAFKVGFINEDSGYQQDERIVYDDGYSVDGAGTDDTATRFEKMDFIGVTAPDQIWKLGRYQMAACRLRPEVHTLNTDFEHLRCTRGDLVRVNHDVIKWGTGFARVVSATVAANVVTIIVDSELTMTDDYSYAARIRFADGTNEYMLIETNAGDQTTIVTRANAAYTTPSGGELITFGVQGTESVECIVSNIVPGDDLSAKLTLVEYNPAIYTAYSGTIPDFDTHINTPPIPCAHPRGLLFIRCGVMRLY